MTTREEAAQAVLASPPARGEALAEARAHRWRRAALPLVVLFALLIRLPVLATPRFQDDYDQLAMMEGRYPSPPGPFDLYNFVNDANRSELIDRGILPCWSNPRMGLRFFRPLSSALLWADRQLFGGRVLFEHLHSLLWWSIACVGVFKLLKSLFSRRVATLGVFIFAIAPCHGYPLAWLANREELVSAALGTFALLAYSRWRERRKARDGLTGLALFAVTMLAGEYSLCFAAYVLAIEATRPREPVLRKALGVLPFALPAVAYLATRQGLHYGAFGTGYYHDPLRDFGAYAIALPRRFSVLFATAWVGVDDRLWVKEVPWKLALLMALTVALLAIPTRYLLRELDGVVRRRSLWLLIGSIAALAPVIVVGPSVRLLEIPMLGVSATVALVLDHVWFPPRPQSRHGSAEWAALAALALAFVHLVRAPLDSWLTQRDFRRLATTFEREMAWLRERAEGKAMVIIVRANLFQTMFAAPLMLDGTTPVRDLSFQSGRFVLLRTAPNAIELVAGKDPLFPVDPEELVRSSSIPLYPSEAFKVSGMRATVLALRDDGQPRRLRFEFDRDLDDSSFLWVVEKNDGFEEQKLPAPGFGEPVPM